ncbi:Protein SYG1 [Neolecta irregularis DAH-3]|uniref:Protein SYG1 n=1 Tax=Neolecta irregularis (strain DAH-3) TaxID=1198029 RepID=A0A1U7LM77_NEOID|nr:Protein SYG1 [Neolecta irregularis DAH-3]|eukprot:OLL23764.1 Protein SYG1 [Neolecta irregularis DAH-3]
MFATLEWIPTHFQYKRGKKLIHVVEREQGKRKNAIRQFSLANRARALLDTDDESQPDRAGLKSSGPGIPRGDQRNGGSDSSTGDNSGKISITARTKRSPQISTIISNIRKPKIQISSNDVPLVGMNEEVKTFFRWLDGQLDKINEFYGEKESESVQRYNVLRCQLQQLQARKAEEARKAESPSDTRTPNNLLDWKHPVERMRTTAHYVEAAFKPANPALNSSHKQILKPVSYRAGRRKIKYALLEFYRSLELLHNYRLLNLNGFAKILKKFDKIAEIKSSKAYLANINDSHFGKSEVLDNIMTRTEAMYAEWFTKGNRKSAIERLRSREKNSEYSPTVFRTGVYIGLSIVLLIDGLIRVFLPEKYPFPEAPWLLQIWAAFGLPLLFLLLFGVNCCVWAENKINYVFIFEFDARNHLAYREYFELPAFLSFLFSFFLWLNFNNFCPDKIHPIYYPLFFVGLVLAIVFNPFDFAHRSSRLWFVKSNGRLLLSGIFAVQFRDFFLGDQYNSLAYTMGNTSLFSCLYANRFMNPEQCNSTHSHIMVVFLALPALWRWLQCFRRYRDNRDYIHLLNAGKYTCTILSQVCLSLWRIKDGSNYEILYILFAVLNGLYTSWWDLFMDWSLMQPHAPHSLLRDQLGFKEIWAYYSAITIDPILRFSWLIYIIAPNRRQHSASTSFFIALIEIFRRFIWNFFRVENEQQTNVGRYRAYRDVPLPFPKAQDLEMDAIDSQQIHKRSIRLENMPAGLRTWASATNSLQNKHAQDFERQKKGENENILNDEISSDEGEESDPCSSDKPKMKCRTGLYETD